MPKNPNLGNRYICFSCGTKFYDLQRPAALCPECGTDQVDAPSLSPTKRLTRSRNTTPDPEPVVEEENSDSDDDEDEEEEEDDNPLELLSPAAGDGDED
ncbi:MAG: hypothetical protein ACI8PZ_001575 [Myxococcota bacterium]|jgi:uncharacterized protein (TIGR02300 family)